MSMITGRRGRSTMLGLLHKQGGRCIWCREPIMLGLPQTHPRRATFDHVKAKALGGTDRVSNLSAACFECNQDKADRPCPGPVITMTRRRAAAISALFSSSEDDIQL